MSLKKLGAATLAVVALGAVLASSAFATATTTAAEWYHGNTAATVATMTESTGVSAELLEHPEIGKKTRLKATVGLANTPITLTATGVTCVECMIENKAVTGKAGNVAFGSGKVEFTGVTVDEPATCAVSGGSVITNLLNIHGDFMEGEDAIIQFRPPTGEEFASFKLINGTGSCGPAGTYVVKGSLFGKATNKTGVASQTQDVLFTPEVNKNAGGELKIGSKIAELTGEARFRSGPTNAAKNGITESKFFSIK